MPGRDIISYGAFSLIGVIVVAAAIRIIKAPPETEPKEAWDTIKLIASFLFGIISGILGLK